MARRKPTPPDPDKHKPEGPSFVEFLRIQADTRGTHRQSDEAYAAKVDSAAYRADAALETYKQMGPGRTMVGLHKILQVDWPVNAPHLDTLYDWAKLYDWDTQIRAFDEEEKAERRRWLHERRTKAMEQQYEFATEAMTKVRAYIDFLMESEKMGSQAAVQLMKNAGDLQRLALGMDREEDRGEQAPPAIRLIIEQDNRPVDLPPTAHQQIVDALPAPSAPSLMITDDTVDTVDTVTSPETDTL